MLSGVEDLQGAMERVMILGGPGAGKSTLARAMGALAELPVIHLDPMFWKPHWVQRSSDETMALVTAAAAQPRWIMDGNHLESFELRAVRADMVVFLDLSVVERTLRLFRRRWQYRGQVRPGMPEGCIERLQPSFLWFAWHYAVDGRRRTKAILRDWDGRLSMVRLRTPAEVRIFLSGLDTEGRG